jgi:hypothetical protein
VSLIHNERWKLTATWLNTLGPAVVVVGVLTPAVAVAYGLSATNRETWLVTFLSTVCMLLGFALHLAGRLLLGRLKQ